MLVRADPKGQEVYEVVILGTGIGGSALGAILARHGVSVLMLEQGSHPRFTIGESTVPETTILLRVLGERYGVPEIRHLSSYQQILRHVGSSCGVKRNFTFLYHRPGAAQRPEETTQLNTAAPPIGPDVHLFRQDVDAYMMTVAVQYGARVIQQVHVSDIEIERAGVSVRCRDGREFRARFVVDAGGLKSALATKYGLRIDPCPLKTRSRTIFTHMVGVRPYDECVPRNPELISPPSQGTLHHLFDGGWMWVIPFNNHPEATNRLVSVGVNLNTDAHPRTGMSPEEEFGSVVNRFPTVARQFEHATSIREWTATDRLQFLSTTAVGERFCMLPHAFGFVDPLFSSGLGLTMNAVNAIAGRLILASRDGDYSRERFQYVDHWMKANIEYFDKLVSCAYVSFRSFALWNAWTRVWMIGGLLGTFAAYELLHRARHSADAVTDPVFESFPYRATQGAEIEEYAALFGAAAREMEAVGSGAASPEETSGRIFSLIEQSRLWPDCWGPLSPARPRHAGSFNLPGLYRNTQWLHRKSPVGVRKHLYVVPTDMDAVRFAVNDLAEGFRRASGSFGRLVRDYVFDYNRDWRAIRQPRPAEESHGARDDNARRGSSEHAFDEATHRLPAE